MSFCLSGLAALSCSSILNAYFMPRTSSWKLRLVLAHHLVNYPDVGNLRSIIKSEGPKFSSLSTAQSRQSLRKLLSAASSVKSFHSTFEHRPKNSFLYSKNMCLQYFIHAEFVVRKVIKSSSYLILYLSFKSWPWRRIYFTTSWDFRERLTVRS